MVTRAQAISDLMVAWLMRDGEFCVGAAEAAKSYAELQDCLRALGVTDEEMAA